MVPGNRVTNKCHCLSLHNLQKWLGIKPRQFTLVRFPSPIEKILVHPPLLETILWIRDCCTAWIGIEVWPSWFSNPMTFRQVTILFFYNTNNIFLTQKQDSPKKKERKIQDYVSKKKKNLLWKLLLWGLSWSSCFWTESWPCMGDDASFCWRTGSRPFLDKTIKGFGE